MDTTTKGFVIAACSVVIATPIWFIAAWIEDSRTVSRFDPCRARSMIHELELSGKVISSTGIGEVDELIRNPDWAEECIKSNKSIDHVASPSY